MPFYLASARTGQAADVIQRFDPRFWTVNFPRPMMASVVTTAPDALRVACEFHHAGELAGLIWASEDTLDHPLLAYDTKRDYAHCVLRFRWRSGGVIALDQPNGPTLTIEGRDALGNARAWYVRLWNYAEGSPEDALVTLRFSELQSGYGLPGEPIHPSDIDRMFISLVPPGYVAGSADPLPQRVDGWAEMSGIAGWGEGAMLPAGDVMVPPHGIGMATAYDDAFDQAPARLVRQIEQLGYRGDVIHYVGMSHFFRLVPGEGGLLAAADGALCGPARSWHAAYFSALAAAGLTPIVSLSYELFAAHCPAAWQQRAWDGAPARTGWDPPSAVLSPASAEAMAWLQAVAREFVALAEEAGCAVKFQIGEPWWWVQPQTGAICCYDDAARNALGAALIDPVAIPDMRQPLDAAQTAVLDAAGTMLAASTAALADAVREAARGPAEILLLAFTPTLLDPAMPELKRAALPVGWAWPAFDRLQLEDYDWCTAGADAARRAAYAEVDRRLGYPATAQDYLAGFVLRPEDAEPYWRRIDAALEDAAARGIPRRFVWALPQVARDGFVRLPPPNPEESPVNAFDDVPYPLALGRDAQVSPEFSTSVAITASGHERRNALWADARLRYDVGPGIRSEAELGTLIAFFRARHGPATGFRLRDPFDFSSNGMTGAPTMLDQPLGEGDGQAAEFQLVKHYGEQVRIITRPVPASIRVSIDGIAASDWSHAGSGRIVFEAAPPVGCSIRAGFLFDVAVRFAEDRLDVSAVNFAAGEAPSVPLVEIREEVA